MSEDTTLVQLQFEGYQIRRIMDEETGEWWYAVVDVIEALTDSQKPRDYWYRMKKRVAENEGIQLSTICRQFKLKAPTTDSMIRIAPMMKVCCVLFNRFHRPRQSHSNVGWLKWARNDWMK